jgi:hypothetical protein
LKGTVSEAVIKRGDQTQSGISSHLLVREIAKAHRMANAVPNISKRSGSRRTDRLFRKPSDNHGFARLADGGATAKNSGLRATFTA